MKRHTETMHVDTKAYTDALDRLAAAPRSPFRDMALMEIPELISELAALRQYCREQEDQIQALRQQNAALEQALDSMHDLCIADGHRHGLEVVR